MSRMRGANASGARERGLVTLFRLYRHGRVERLRRLDKVNAAQSRPQSGAEFLPAHAAAHEPASVERRTVQRTLPAQRLEHRAAQQTVELAAMERAAVREGRALDLRPQARAVGRDDEDAALWGEHAPKLAHQGPHR